MSIRHVASALKWAMVIRRHAETGSRGGCGTGSFGWSGFFAMILSLVRMSNASGAEGRRARIWDALKVREVRRRARLVLAWAALVSS